MYQLECRHVALIHELLIKGTCMTFADRDERTPSHLVGECAHVDMVREMLSKGASWKIREKLW